ncbi:hypothetical protein SDC9_199032 [bioreactor metagenome]|uniref:Uncharacterized protein n=1 Tax=bioreactor metagenome TaxID=1076179 RepID=A0A645IJC4_9ZZZZ
MFLGCDVHQYRLGRGPLALLDVIPVRGIGHCGQDGHDSDGDHQFHQGETPDGTRGGLGCHG